MKLGAFSVSLAVKDIQRSVAFYEALGFELAGDYSDQGWCVMRSDTTTIGLFQGMFEDNILTFNPGWAQDVSALEDFEDVRALQARLEAAGLEVDTRADDGDGPAHLVLRDPDGNIIMFDQHVPKP